MIINKVKMLSPNTGPFFLFGALLSSNQKAALDHEQSITTKLK